MPEQNQIPTNEQRSKERRLQQLVIATLKRARDADIPEDMLRINKNTFQNLLYEKYFNDVRHISVEKFSNAIYNNSDKLFTYPFILIDGGSSNERKMAGFALLFKMIACGKNGKYEQFNTFAHKFQGSKNFEEQSRTSYIEEISSYDILFLSEFSLENVKSTSPDAGCYIDEVLEKRKDKGRPTIISFYKPLYSKDIPDIIANTMNIVENTYGQYLYALSNHEKKQMHKALRIKVKGS